MVILEQAGFVWGLIIDCDGPDGHGVMVMWLVIDEWLCNMQNDEIDESDGSGVMITEFV